MPPLAAPLPNPLFAKAPTMSLNLRTAFTLSTLALACGGAFAQAATATLDKVKASGSITLAYREASIPFLTWTTKPSPRALRTRSAARSSTK